MPLGTNMEIPGFWDVGPHDSLPVEETWNQFINISGGKMVSSLLSKSPSFENADYIFEHEQVIMELKVIETEFTHSSTFEIGYIKLLERLVKENPNWKPYLFGGDGKFPIWFYKDFIRLARPNISRVIKKANRQIRNTKLFFGYKISSGVLLFVNDGFTGITPDLVQALVSDILRTSYSSIDCCIYLTVNRYIEIPNSDVPKLIWWPVYSDRAAEFLVEFINNLGRKWFDYLENNIGPFTKREEISTGNEIFKGSKAIIIPNEKRA